ncbi:MAG: hypothetical protein JRN39_00915 [Nitrososphaerota archaeon]|nr:hypothetical protein [Nitrososphaerota archaeon]MDG6938955.1 hypothetical protein [Nitrososphaerota archaeon]
MSDRNAETARVLALMAILVAVVFFMLGIFSSAFTNLLFDFGRVAGALPGGTDIVPYFFDATFLGTVFIFSLLVSLLWILLDYFLVYRPLADGDVARAEPTSLVLGVLQLLLGGVLPGIFLIVSWVKARDSLRVSGSIK